jgi:L-iditol 2-dehydrogenase
MRAARLHGPRDLRVEEIPVPEPGPRDLLVRVEGCGICPTDVRKYLAGLSAEEYPFNSGHEWVGRIEAVGEGLSGWQVGQRVYGDTYAGYGEFATIGAEPGDWSHGALAIRDDLPLERAVFVEPLADCLHAVHDQARVQAGDRVLVLGAGQMGLQVVLVASLAGAVVLAADLLAKRRELAVALGAAEALGPDDWTEACADAVILTVGDAALVPPALAAAAPGGRVVLFAGFAQHPGAVVDLNRIHYQEIALVGSEWIGAPPNQGREWYGQAHELLASGAAPLERLVTARCGLDGIEGAYEALAAHRELKALVVP